MAGASASAALLGAASSGWPALVVITCGLLISAGYSFGPVRIADRGVVASLVLPACYVAVPFLLAAFSVHRSIGWPQVELLAGLYLGFIGRIVLKDFRDLRGDALFGKRTFLVRHGRGPTLVFSALFTTAGTAVIMAVDGPSLVWVSMFLALLVSNLGVLRALAADSGHRRDENLISASAILGRGIVTVLLIHLEMTSDRRPSVAAAAIGAFFVVLTLGQARRMVRSGPTTTLTLPPGRLTTPVSGPLG
jgi:4-hydroxybenzoate polyprenyltransferase